MQTDQPQPYTRRSALILGAGGGAVAAVAAQARPADAATALATRRETYNVTAYGALGNGTHDDTAAIQAAFKAAAKVKGSTVFFPAAPGGCYRTSGLTVPAGVGSLLGESTLYDANAPGTVSLAGSVLGPLDSATTTLLTIGASGAGAAVDANPHGIAVDGLGFLGTTPAGAALPNFWGATVTDTSDVTFRNCRDLYCGAPGFTGYPTGGTSSGGFVRFLSSGTGNVYSVNGRVLYCCSYGAGTFLLADGLSTAYPGGGSTDGYVQDCQVNGHERGVQLGPTLAGAGGWLVLGCHFSSSMSASHIAYGAAGAPWTLRVEACYFDLSQGTPLVCHGRGLQAIGNYFRALSNTTAVYFGSALSAVRRDPAAVLSGNVLDLYGSTTITSFAKFAGFTAAGFAADGGGAYSGNLVHSHGMAVPASWIAPFVGSDGKAIADASTVTLNLSRGPVLAP